MLVVAIWGEITVLFSIEYNFLVATMAQILRLKEKRDGVCCNLRALISKDKQEMYYR
jgi:hypothetical protein